MAYLVHQLHRTLRVLFILSIPGLNSRLLHRPSVEINDRLRSIRQTHRSTSSFTDICGAHRWRHATFETPKWLSRVTCSGRAFQGWADAAFYQRRAVWGPGRRKGVLTPEEVSYEGAHMLTRAVRKIRVYYTSSGRASTLRPVSRRPHVKHSVPRMAGLRFHAKGPTSNKQNHGWGRMFSSLIYF